MQENNHFYLGAADTDVLRPDHDIQLTLVLSGQFWCSQMALATSMGTSSKTPGTDGVCDTVDDAFYRIDLNTSPNR